MFKCFLSGKDKKICELQSRLDSFQAEAEIWKNEHLKLSKQREDELSNTVTYYQALAADYQNKLSIYDQVMKGLRINIKLGAK